MCAVKNTATQTTGLRRATIDKFYTSPATVEQCMKLVETHILVDPNDLCIEPSAGNGAFIPGIKSLFNNYKFYDLAPEHPEIAPQDYLDFDHKSVSSGQHHKIHVIGNPPFGRQSSLAIKFIKKSSAYCATISFILPKSFKKDSLKKHFPPKFHLAHESDLADNSFMINGVPYDVPCVFQIWIRKDTDRDTPAALCPTSYRFVKRNEHPDISFRRVGVNAGHIDRHITNQSIQSHYFIKFSVPLTDTLFNKLKNIVYDCRNNTCGPKSISKQELIKEFNALC